MQLQWDGNNSSVDERSKNFAFGTGTNPTTIDLPLITRIEVWLPTLEPLAYPYLIDHPLATKGASICAQYCAECHGRNGRDFTALYVVRVLPIEEIGTDRYRPDSFSHKFSTNLS